MRRHWLAGIFAVCALWALLVAVFTNDSVHRTWGVMAAVGYSAALLVLLVRHPRAADSSLGVAFAGALLAPLGWLAVKGLEQPEVYVVARSGSALIHQGTPYADAAVLAGTTDPNAYNPYLPVMALFGIPRALADVALTDPRIWFGLVFLAVFWPALRVAGARAPVRWTILVAASPVIAFNLATGGDDVPMVAFLCLGFAFLWPGLAGQAAHPVKAGLALGIASAMKATAWPALAVAIALVAARDGRRAAGQFTLTALAVVVACVGPFIADPRTLVENTILFPLGLAHVTSQASSPLPGHAIASTGHVGHTIVVALLVLAGVAVAASLVFRPQRTVPRAVLLLAGAMTLMFLLAPSTRFGYFIYPATLGIWLLAVVAGRRAAPEDEVPPHDVRPGPGAPPASSRTSGRTSPVTRPAA